MGIELLQQWLTTPIYGRRDIRVFTWLSLAFACALIYSFMGLQQAFAHPNVIHDDVRSHVFWMYRFLDPSLFPNDIIADYFQSVAPYGYTTVYRGAAWLGVEPILFNKLLPLVLVLITTGYCFWLAMSIFPVPAASFLATLLLNQTTWGTHDIPSGTPRAFIYPLFIAFLYYLVQRSLLPCLVTIVLQGLFYPQCLFLSCGMLVLRVFQVQWGQGRFPLRLSPDRRDYWFCGAGLAIAFIMLLPYALKISDYDPVLTRAQALTLPILQNDGRKNFFFDDPFKFWFCGERSGMLPYDWCKYEEPPQVWATLWLLPMFVWSKYFPLLKKTTHHVVVLPQILVASLGMFFLAHLLLFKLHLPSRYTKHSLRIMVAIAAGIALICLLEAALNWLRTTKRIPALWQTIGAISSVGLLTAYSFSHPFLMETYPNPDYVDAQPPELYDFFGQQPKDVVIASLSEEANNIPSLSKRSVLTSSEIANPYHFGYYQIIKKRTLDLLKAQYSTNRSDVLDVIQTYDIDFWLIDRNAFNWDYIENRPWLRDNPSLSTQIQQDLQDGKRPIIARMTRRCTALKTQEHIVLESQCILDELQQSSTT
ncbi:MAG: hypothetical protein VKJ64_18755 [Leptolyngbyaceae bacterium]|nr:hypothetical protein [Leptolyngbyaceae bacterium]